MMLRELGWTLGRRCCARPLDGEGGFCEERLILSARIWLGRRGWEAGWTGTRRLKEEREMSEGWRYEGGLASLWAFLREVRGNASRRRFSRSSNFSRGPGCQACSGGSSRPTSQRGDSSAFTSKSTSGIRYIYNSIVRLKLNEGPIVDVVFASQGQVRTPATDESRHAIMGEAAQWNLVTMYVLRVRLTYSFVSSFPQECGQGATRPVPSGCSLRPTKMTNCSRVEENFLLPSLVS